MTLHASRSRPAIARRPGESGCRRRKASCREDAGAGSIGASIIPAIKPTSRPPTPISPAGTSVSGPKWRYIVQSSAPAETHHFAFAFPLRSKSLPPLPPPIGNVVRAFLKVCSKPRNLRMEKALPKDGSAYRLYRPIAAGWHAPCAILPAPRLFAVQPHQRETELRALVQPNVPVKTCGGNGVLFKKRQGGHDFTTACANSVSDAVALCTWLRNDSREHV